MNLVAFVIVLCTVLYVSTSSAISRNEAAVLELFPGAKIRRQEGSRLVVNCTSHSDETPVAMVWKASRAHDNMRSETIDNHTVALVFESLHRSDAGFYICYLFLPRGKKYIETVHVSVLSISTKGNHFDPCASTEFRCNNGMCVFLQYRCDNRNDCEDNSDEENCGKDPCQDKFMCKNSRCIGLDLVCDKFHNNDCEDMSDELCTLVEGSFGDWQSSQSAATIPPHQASVDVQMRWLKTTVYSVIGCTVGVVLLIAVLVIAIFRIKMKRTVARRQLMFLERRRQEHATARHSFRFPEMDPFLASQSLAPPYSHNNIILNVNNGVQYVPGLECTSIMEAPPPYSDTSGHNQSTRSDSPPPPYTTIDRRTRDNNVEGGEIRGANSASLTVSDAVNNNNINTSGCSNTDRRTTVSPHSTDNSHGNSTNSSDSNSTHPKTSPDAT